jgi:hypothetical protein
VEFAVYPTDNPSLDHGVPLGCRSVSELDQVVRPMVRDCLGVSEGEDVLVVRDGGLVL